VVSCSWGPGGRIQYSVRMIPAADYVDVEMTIRNHTEFLWHEVFAFNCLNPTGAPDFKDWTLERTYMSSQGRPLCLARTERVRGHMPTVGFYLPDRIETGRESIFVRGFGATSPDRTDGSWIVTLSQPQGAYMAAAVVEAAFLFDNLDRCCIHAAPAFGDIGPGQTAMTVSRFYLAKGSLEDFLQRYAADRPALAARQKATSLPTAGERIAAARSAAKPRRSAQPDGDSQASPGTPSRYSCGAKFEPPAGRVVHAMGQWEQYNAKLLPLLPAELRPASKLIFLDIGDTPRGWRPEAIRTMIQRHNQDKFIPHIDIALRGNQPPPAARAALADPLFGIDHEVASSSRFDGRIQDLVRIVKEFGKPIIVRIGGEFNGPWNGYHPYAYPQAFRKIVEMFRAAQVDNAAFVWCYEPAAPGDFDEHNADGEYKWFPGADVIDWFAIDWFNTDDFTISPVLMEKLAAELRRPQYLHAGDKTRLKDYGRFAPAQSAPTPNDAGQPRPHQAPPVRPIVAEPDRSRGDKRAEFAKFDEPAAHLPAKGPGGTEWDSHYRSFIQSDQNAVVKGLPDHAEAARQIKADAARDPAHLQRHKGWVLFVKHHSQAYRPPEATEVLRQLYQDLIEMEFGIRPEPTSARQTPGGVTTDGLTIHRDVVYGKTHPEVQRLDAYLVKLTGPTPVLIEIHGGGWRRGSKSQFLYPGDLIERVLDAGISVVSIDYRLTPAHPFPAQMEDTVRTVQFVRSRARDWNIDPNRIAAIGGSAGAHLAAWVGLHDDVAQPRSLDPIERFSSRLTCFAALSGPMDLTRVDPRTLEQAGARGESFAEAFTAAVGATAEQFMTDPEIRRRLKEASPLFLVSSDDPPALFLGAGPAETAAVAPTIPAIINDPHSAWHGALLADAMHRVGVPMVTRLGPDVGKNPQADAAIIVDFLKKHLKKTEP
jgi:acetyl esterase